MKIAMFHPTDRDKIFTEYSEHDFIFGTCDNSCDIIYAASISRLPQALEAKNKYKKPLVCWCWDIPYNWRDWNMSKQGVSDNLFRDNVNAKRVKELKQCDLVITPTKWVQNTIKSEYDIDSIQIYQYIDVVGLDAIPNQSKTNNIIQVSRFFYNKKFHETVIATRDTNYQTHFFGTGINGNYGREIKSTIQKYNKNVNIHEGASRSELIKHIKQSKLLVSPSVFEGWGITPVEAIYCGTPILLSDLPVFKEVYRDNILYHERNNPEDMKEKIEMILGDKTLQEKIIKNCQPIISEFTPDKFAKRWDTTIKNNL
jgi:glycosyltransferase involved in cell wall biosynthesis